MLFANVPGLVPRPFWQAEIERAWAERRVVWLTGPRRVGKTTLVAIECKWRAGQFDPSSFRSFRTLHPDASCWVVAQDRDTAIRRRHGGVEFTECGLGNLDALASRHAG